MSVNQVCHVVDLVVYVEVWLSGSAESGRPVGHPSTKRSFIKVVVGKRVTTFFMIPVLHDFLILDSGTRTFSPMAKVAVNPRRPGNLVNIKQASPQNSYVTVATGLLVVNPTS